MKASNVTPNHIHSAIYGFGVIGALIYFIQHAQSVWTGIIGIIESIFWPAVMVYKIFEYFKL